MQARKTDEESIRRVATAYLESWLDGDGERMRDALHPDLAKRGLDYAADRRPSGVHHLTAEYMERSAAKGPRPQFARTCEITVLDIADSIASAKVVSQPFIDYLHLAKLDGRWSIVNVLYEDREPASEQIRGGQPDRSSRPEGKPGRRQVGSANSSSGEGRNDR